MGTNKRKDKLRKTKKRLSGGDGGEEVKYIVRKSKIDDKKENVILQVFLNSGPNWADFSITELLQNNMNMVDETLARLRFKQDENEEDDDIIYEETIKIGHKPPKAGLEKENKKSDSGFNEYFNSLKDNLRAIYNSNIEITKMDSNLNAAKDAVKTATDENNKQSEESKVVKQKQLKNKQEFNDILLTPYEKKLKEAEEAKKIKEAEEFEVKKKALEAETFALEAAKKKALEAVEPRKKSGSGGRRRR
jgi:hypothetical protein